MLMPEEKIESHEPTLRFLLAGLAEEGAQK